MQGTADSARQCGKAVAEVPGADEHRTVAGVLEQLHAPQVLEPLATIHAVMIALVLQKHACVSVSEIRVPEAFCGHHGQLHLGLRQTVSDQPEAEERLLRRVHRTADPIDRERERLGPALASMSGERRTKIGDRAQRMPPARPAWTAHQVVPHGDQPLRR